MSGTGNISKRVVKVVMVGNTGVGKTRIVYRFASGLFGPEGTSTLGIDCKMKTITVENGASVKLQIWDPAGQERFNSITTAYYRGAMGIAFVFDVTDRKSFDDIPGWVSQVQKNASEHVMLMLMGNKNDISTERTVTREDGQQCAEFYSMIYMEVSAKTGENIDEAFGVLANEIVVKSDAMTSEATDTVGVTASVEARASSGGKGCGC